MVDDNRCLDQNDYDAFPDIARLEERYLAAAVAVRDGWINRTGLTAIAFRPAEVGKDGLDVIERSLVRSGRLESREERFNGRHGGKVRQYRATSLVVPEPRDPYAELVTTLALSDRLTLLAFAHAQAEHEAAEGRPGAWLRISLALNLAERATAGLATEFDSADHPGAAEGISASEPDPEDSVRADPGGSS